MSGGPPLAAVLEDRRLNAVLAWTLTGFVALVAVEELLVGDLLWSLFAVTVVALAVVPPVTYRDPTVMLPWEVLALGAFPVVGRSLLAAGLLADVATYLSVAALALVVAVELDVFTPVRMPDWFAVLLVVVTTVATAGVWAVLQWLSDLYLGTGFVLDPALTPDEQEAAVMWDFVAATAAGMLAGITFEVYFRRLARTAKRLPADGGGESGAGGGERR